MRWRDCILPTQRQTSRRAVTSTLNRRSSVRLHRLQRIRPRRAQRWQNRGEHGHDNHRHGRERDHHPVGKIKITGADYLVYASDWDAKHPGDPPQLGGQLFHLFDSPNRFGLPPFYTLHVWAWKDNPNGTFTNWNPDVSCDGYSGGR